MTVSNGDRRDAEPSGRVASQIRAALILMKHAGNRPVIVLTGP